MTLLFIQSVQNYYSFQFHLCQGGWQNAFFVMVHDWINDLFRGMKGQIVLGAAEDEV